ncbi:probable phenylalanine--tRNA ligase, mitochondrial [Orussus abietinus]|uniref:probable phenylalanine--tRNA ligase, mitochondrial n=1 Tax=Orussus abietinus TaxID=222816 RepID=UPI000C71628C|nr:probable phenylalanine--tRNA ligase, mitochondrial [Orussus abietinus]
MATRKMISNTFIFRQFSSKINILDKTYPTDSWTNLTPKILSYVGKNLHLVPYHPLSLLRQRIVNYVQDIYRKRTNEKLCVYDMLNPVVTVYQNFDSLLIPKDHISRCKNDCYYVNRDHLLRAHTTAHQAELISKGLKQFLVVGDVYRRDEIDSTHYPVFHQIDGVGLYTMDSFRDIANTENVELFERKGVESSYKQKCHTMEAVKIMEDELKSVLLGLAWTIFGKDVHFRWTDDQFPFTHPSWELEVEHKNKWIEVLGCGIVHQEILNRAGANDSIGWAFGLGLERLAMCLYDIPDIRLFWSTDPGFLNQFNGASPETLITYKPVSIYPPCTNDISFWLPQDGDYSSADFYDIVREIAGDIVEQIKLIDEFVHPKTMQLSHCYKIVYRHMERTLSQKEVNDIHKSIQNAVSSKLRVSIR